MVGTCRWSVGGPPTTYRPPFYGAACSRLPSVSKGVMSMNGLSFVSARPAPKPVVCQFLWCGEFEN